MIGGGVLPQMARRKSPQFASRFAELLQNYMWDQRPPLSQVEFARQLGIGRTTLTNWLSGGRPEMALLFVVNERTGIPLNRLMETAGYPAAPDPDAAFEYILADLRADPDLAEDERAFLVRRISELRERYSLERTSPEPSEPEGSEGSHPGSATSPGPASGPGSGSGAASGSGAGAVSALQSCGACS